MEKEMQELKSDILTLVGRLYSEDPDSFAPETREVMGRWRPQFQSLYCTASIMAPPIHGQLADLLKAIYATSQPCFDADDTPELNVLKADAEKGLKRIKEDFNEYVYEYLQTLDEMFGEIEPF